MRFPDVVLLSACALMWTATLLAQSPNGVINGLVVDPSNKVIVGADVVVVNDVTGLKYTTKTNDEGIYVLPNLPPGPYRLQVAKIGFKTTIKPDIVLNLQDALSINFTLPVGASYETVTVEAGASIINTTDASVSTVVDQTYVKNMPLNGRSFQDLILLTPGVVTQTPQNSATGLGQTGEFSVNGQRPESNYFTVDGVSGNMGAAADISMTMGAGFSGSIPAATILGTTQALVSVDDLQEFRVQSSTYSAEYGRNPGGQFAFQTKSGTNQWHVTVFDYLRNGFFDAQDWFNDYFGTPAPVLRQNDFGGIFGGPIRIPRVYNGKDKTFFFVSYEGLRLAAPQAANVNYVPDARLRAAAPTSVQKALNAYPVANGPEVSVACDPATDRACPPSGQTQDGIAQFIASWSNPALVDSTSVRFDHLVNEKLKLFFRFSDTGSSTTARQVYSVTSGTPTARDTLANTMRTYTAGVTSVLTSRLSNELRLNFSSNDADRHTSLDTFGGGIPVNIALLSGLSSGSAGQFALDYDGYFSLLVSQRQGSGAQKQWNFVDTVNLSLGRHQVKLGTDYRRLAPFAILPNPLVAYYYEDETSVEANTPFILVQSNAPAHPLYMNLSVFAQDEWKVLSRLSLSLGVRWEVNPAPGVTQGTKPYTLQGSNPNTWTLAPEGSPLWHTTCYNFAPRLGVAYLLRSTPSRETVVRGGGGLFYDTGQQLGSLGINSGLGFSLNAFPAGSFPEPIVPPPIANPPIPPYDVVAFSPHLQLPYTIQWNASIQQALGKSQAFTVSYVGSHAGRLLKENEILLPNNPTIFGALLVQNGLTSDYDALQLQFRRRMAQGLTVLASYTWSHCMDYGSQNYQLAYLRGDCDFDVRQSLSTALSYDLPNARQNTFLGAIFGHWGVDNRFTARTAFPVALSGNFVFDPVTGQEYHTGLNIVPGIPVYLFGANCTAVLQGLQDLQVGQDCPGGRAINPNAFAAVSSGLGDAPRNFVRGFGAYQIDIATRRDFSVNDHLKLQFRAEAFNLLNHPSFGTINPQFGTSSFGQVTATLANSLGTLSPLYQTGGHRSMQFALRLSF